MHQYSDFTPVTWYEEGNYRIMDLTKEKYDDALSFLEKFYIPNKIAFQNLLTSGDGDIETKCNQIKSEFREILKKFLNYELSLIGHDTTTNEIFAVMVNTLMTNEQQSWDMWSIYPEDPIIETIFELEKCLVMNSVTKLGLDKPRDSLHVFVLSVAPNHKGNNWKIKFLMAASKLAKDLQIPFLTYIGYTMNDHKRALRFGMEETGRYSLNEFEKCESILHLDLLPRNSQAIYHELNVDKLPSSNETTDKSSTSDILSISATSHIV